MSPSHLGHRAVEVEVPGHLGRVAPGGVLGRGADLVGRLADVELHVGAARPGRPTRARARRSRRRRSRCSSRPAGRCSRSTPRAPTCGCRRTGRRRSARRRSWREPAGSVAWLRQTRERADPELHPRLEPRGCGGPGRRPAGRCCAAASRPPCVSGKPAPYRANVASSSKAWPRDRVGVEVVVEVHARRCRSGGPRRGSPSSMKRAHLAAGPGRSRACRRRPSPSPGAGAAGLSGASAPRSVSIATR